MKFFDRPTIVGFIAILVAIILWVLEEGALELSSVASYIGAIAGIFAISFMSFDFISSTRLGFLEKFAGGLDVLYRFHSYVAKLAAIILVVHPLFLMIQRFAGLDTVKRYFLPGTTEFFNYGIYAFWLVLVLVVITLFVRMPYRLWKYTHLLMYVVYVLASYHVFLDFTNAQRSPGISLKEGYLLFIIVLGLLALVYKMLVYPFMAKRFKVAKVNPIGLVTEVYMEPEKDKMDFVPGQYVFMSVRGNKDLSSETHPFGITSSVQDKTLRVSIKALGDWTKKAGLIKPGDDVRIWGPHGMFTWKSVEKYQKIVWIAGGIGVAPFLSMIKYANETNSDKDLSLFYVEKNASECEYNDELKELTKNGPVKFYTHYDDQSGFITAKAIEQMAGDLGEAVVMICGPKKMMRALKAQFSEMGLKHDQIREEEFEMRR